MSYSESQDGKLPREVLLLPPSGFRQGCSETTRHKRFSVLGSKEITGKSVSQGNAYLFSTTLPWFKATPQLISSAFLLFSGHSPGSCLYLHMNKSLTLPLRSLQFCQEKRILNSDQFSDTVKCLHNLLTCFRQQSKCFLNTSTSPPMGCRQ